MTAYITNTSLELACNRLTRLGFTHNVANVGSDNWKLFATFNSETIEQGCWIRFNIDSKGTRHIELNDAIGHPRSLENSNATVTFSGRDAEEVVSRGLEWLELRNGGRPSMNVEIEREQIRNQIGANNRVAELLRLRKVEIMTKGDEVDTVDHHEFAELNVTLDSMNERRHNLGRRLADLRWTKTEDNWNRDCSRYELRNNI